MFVCHKLAWGACLSNAIFHGIEKANVRWAGSKDIHLFWGLGSTNIPEIEKCKQRGQEWWIIDCGYLSTYIHRYPTPKVIEKKATYYRFCKGGLHNNLTDVSDDDTRFKKLLKLDNIPYAKKILEYEPTEVDNNGSILLTPSSNQVCSFQNGMSQADWTYNVVKEIKQHTQRKVEFRNKPRPDNKWWNRPISEDLKTSSALVTNMSLTAIDALVNGIPCVVDKGNVCSSISSTSYEDINNLKMPSKDDVLTWGFKSANCQFTINEIESGEFYEYLK
jgi:hypothetical protein